MNKTSLQKIIEKYEVLDQDTAYSTYDLNGYEFHCLGVMIKELKKDAETFTMSGRLATMFKNCGFNISVKNHAFVIK